MRARDSQSCRSDSYSGGPDVIKFDPGLGRIYVACYSGAIAVFHQDVRLTTASSKTFACNTAYTRSRSISKRTDCTRQNRKRMESPSPGWWFMTRWSTGNREQVQTSEPLKRMAVDCMKTSEYVRALASAQPLSQVAHCVSIIPRSAGVLPRNFLPPHLQIRFDRSLSDGPPHFT
jgi:hypothetical protein